MLVWYQFKNVKINSWLSYKPQTHTHAKTEKKNRQAERKERIKYGKKKERLKKMRNTKKEGHKEKLEEGVIIIKEKEKN